MPPATIYDHGPTHAVVVSDLPRYFETTVHNSHYSISPCLRQEVAEIAPKSSRQKQDLPVFVVVQEHNALEPTVMEQGECSIQDEVRCENGHEYAILVGGRKGKRFVTAWRATDGRWPSVPDNERQINTILTAVRVEQDAVGPIEKLLDQSCFVTDDGLFVDPMGLSASARATTVRSMDAQALTQASARIRRAIALLEPDAEEPHVGLLVDSLRWDKDEENAERRVRYLSLWQSLVEARKKLGFSKKIDPETKDIVAGQKTLGELTKHRDEVAHHQTNSIDDHSLRDIQLTINELVRKRYFRVSSKS